MKKNIVYSIIYSLLVIALMTIFAVFIMDKIDLDMMNDSWYPLITYTTITTIPIGIIRLIGNKSILPIKIGIILTTVFSMVIAGIDSLFTIYSILFLSILNIVKDKK